MININFSITRRTIIISLGVFVVIGVFATSFYKINSTIKGQKALILETQTELGTKASELEELQKTLNATEAGKKQVENAKAVAESNATKQANRANSAEADANNAKAQLGTVNAQLSNANSQLSSVTSQLSGANVQLANVNRCVSLFNGIKGTISQYQDAQISENRYSNLGTAAFNSDNYSLYTYYLGLSNEQTRIANNLWPSINSTLSRVVSGSCY